MKNLSINLADRLDHFPVSRLNGPGLRYSFWVQGCSVRCTKDCLNSAYLPMVPKVVIPVEQVAAHIISLKQSSGIEGITILGGEPFDQAEALAYLGDHVHKAGLSVVTYTGHTLEHLHQKDNPAWLALLAVTDILIDGPFISSLRSDALRWCGSSNQRVLFLTERYNEKDVLSTPVEKGVNILMQPDGTLKISGMQNKEQLQDFIQTLEEGGVIRHEPNKLG